MICIGKKSPEVITWADKAMRHNLLKEFFKACFPVLNLFWFIRIPVSDRIFWRNRRYDASLVSELKNLIEPFEISVASVNRVHLNLVLFLGLNFVKSKLTHSVRINEWVLSLKLTLHLWTTWDHLLRLTWKVYIFNQSRSKSQACCHILAWQR